MVHMAHDDETTNALEQIRDVASALQVESNPRKQYDLSRRLREAGRRLSDTRKQKGDACATSTP